MSASSAPKPVDQRNRLLTVQGLAVAAGGVLLFSRPAWSEASMLHDLVEMTGLGLALLCVFGRLWSILYIGNRKGLALVTCGPYSISRNPLYLFSTIGAVGVGLMFGSLVVAAVLGVLAFLVFQMTAHKEASFLRSKFSLEYAEYAARTPLFWPNLRLYRDECETVFYPRALRKAFCDALYFLAAFPIIEAAEHLHLHGDLPTFFWLY